MPRTLTLWLLLVAPLLLAACNDTASLPAPSDEETTVVEAPPVLNAGFASIGSMDLRTRIAVLSSDAFERRGTGTSGDEKIAEYIREQMQAAELAGTAEDC